MVDQTQTNKYHSTDDDVYLHFSKDMFWVD